MIGAVLLATALLVLDASRGTVAQTCPSSGVQVTTKLILQAEEASTQDSIRKLASCLGIQDCQLSKFDFGKCGSGKIQRVEGAAKAAVIAFDPAGCTEVYNCGGVYVDSEVFNEVVSESCTPTQFGADVVGLCGGVLLPTNVMKAITCQTCTGDICKGCSAAGISQDQCKAIKNCSSARRSLLQTAELKCSSAKVTINAASAEQATALTAKLESKTALTDLGTCMGRTISSIGPNGLVTAAGR